MTEKTDKSGKKHSFGRFIDRLFRGRSYSLPSAPPGSSNAKDAKKKKKLSKSASEDVAEADFGIVETERLQHFQKPKPPANRRRPASSRASVTVMGSRAAMPEQEPKSPTSLSPSTPSLPSLSSLPPLVLPALKRSETFKEEEEHDADAEPRSPSAATLESPKVEDVVVVQDKKVEVEKLFTPPLPPPAALKPKPKSGPESPKPKPIEEVEEDVRKSDSIEVISESEVSLRKNSDSTDANAVADADVVVGNGRPSSSTSTSNKSSVSILSAKSFSNKIDFEQIRVKSKNLRLVKSLEVGQKLADDDDSKSRVRASDPGRQ